MLTRFRKTLRHKPFHFSHVTQDRQLLLPSYTPASWQAEAFHASDKHIKALFGGDRSGKTGTVSFEMASLMRKFPGALFWTAALTEKKLYAVWEWHKKLFHPQEIKYVSWRKTNKIPEYFIHRNGAMMEYKTWRSGAGDFAADSVKAIHLDEDGQRVTSEAESIYNDCLSRILDNDGYVFVSATPVLGKNWMFSRIFDYNRQNREDGSKDPDIERWTVSLLDNTFIDHELKIKAKGRMSKDEIQRRFYGQFTVLSGAVFKEFREEMHVLKEEPVIDASWRKIRAIDLGYENPFCCLWIAIDEDERIYFYDEYYQQHTLIKDHAANIERISASHHDMYANLLKFRPFEANICDHERQTRAELDAAGIMTSPAIKDVESGIQTVNRALMMRGDGTPGVYISPRCQNLIRQMGNYHYKPVRGGNENKELIDKIDDHAVDPARYGIVYFKQGRRNYTVE